MAHRNNHQSPDDDSWSSLKLRGGLRMAPESAEEGIEALCSLWYSCVVLGCRPTTALPLFNIGLHVGIVMHQARVEDTRWIVECAIVLTGIVLR